MVQGLAFLSKKSWHVKNVANQERVWIEEQKKAAEETKTKELAKQIQQEREEEEMDRIAGKKSNRLDRGIDWMYQGVTSEAAQEDAKKSAEDYLMGKEFTGGTAAMPQGDLVQAENEKEGVNAVLSSVAVAEPESTATNNSRASIMSGPSVADRNEAFRVRHEDPMFMVSQKRREQEVKVEKKKALYERVVGIVNDADDDGSYQRRKREKKEHKKAKKRRKEERRRRRRDRSRSRDRSDSEDDYRRHSSPVHRGRRSESPDNYRRSRADEGYYRSGARTSRYDDSPRHERRREGRRDDREYGPNRKDDRNYDNGSRRKDDRRYDSDHRGYNNDGHRAGERPEQRKTFGLLGASKPVDFNQLGPNRDLVAQRRKEQERERSSRKPPPRRRMNSEEREQALRVMQLDAKRHNSNRVADRPVEREETRKSAAFLHTMAQETHGIRSDHRSMAERVAQNRNTNQNSDGAFL